MSDKFYPQLSNIVSLDSLPEQLSFIEGGLQQIFSNLHYRNYQVSQSSDKITTTRNLELVSFEELKIPILGTGIVLSFNSDFQSGGESYIPLSITKSKSTGSRLLDFIEMDISRFIYKPEWEEGINVDFDDISINDINNIKTYTLYCFNAKFLPFLKSKIISEGVSI